MFDSIITRAPCHVGKRPSKCNVTQRGWECAVQRYKRVGSNVTSKRNGVLTLECPLACFGEHPVIIVTRNGRTNNTGT